MNFAPLLCAMADLDYLAYLETLITEERRAKFIEILKFRTNHFMFAMEDVFQMHNTSAVMRSCEVFGIQNLSVIEERFGKKLDRKIAMGAQKWVDIKKFDTVQDCLDDTRARGYRIIATTPHENDCLLEDFDISQRSAIFFGTELTGLSQEIIDQADGFLKIPMVGFTESLNISVSAAIIAQNLTQRLRASDLPWQLTEEEVLQKRIDWAKASIRSIADIEKRYFAERG
ncbi:MAG TPA: RNA methyltransferase [Flavobacterium sp.]|nr:RNA methyltransferase [Flavobacterium sp.]